MDWLDIYRTKLTTAEKAIQVVQSGQRIVFAHACGEPQILVDELVAQAERLENVEIFHMVAMGKANYCQPGMEKHFRHHSVFLGSSTRKAVNEGRGDFTPCFLHESPKLLRSLPIDVSLIQVSRPDEHGYCSFGVSVDYTTTAAEVAKVVIAEVNEQMPRTLGDCHIHVTEIDYAVETSTPLIELFPSELTEVEEKIGYHVAQLVESGATLQLGIGAIPDAVLRCLRDKKNLGIHTEMFSDGVVDLIEKGVINNSAKTLHKGKAVATFLMGTKKLYNFVHNNPLVEMYPVYYTNDPYIVGKNFKMTAINSALQIDLTGQVCAESLGPKQFSGTGGQVDFVRGANLSPGGKSIIALPSTAMGGKLSRIVPCLDRGAAVTTLRNEVHFVVTEYGYVELKGKSIRKRAEALIAIAHPDFREMLTREFARIYVM